MPAAPPEKSNTQGGAPDTGTADAGRLRGRALIVPTWLLLLGGISYGGIFSANMLAAGVSFPVFAYTFWIALFAGLALLIVGAVAGTLPPMSRAHLLQYLRLALLAVMLPVLATAIAARELPAGVITLVLTLVPRLTYLMSFTMRLERFEALSLAGLTLGAGGVLLIVLPDQALPDAGAWVWMLVALVAAVAAAGSNVVAAAYRPPQTHSLALACGILLAAAVVMLPVMLVAGRPLPLHRRRMAGHRRHGLGRGDPLRHLLLLPGGDAARGRGLLRAVQLPGGGRRHLLGADHLRRDAQPLGVGCARLHGGRHLAGQHRRPAPHGRRLPQCGRRLVTRAEGSGAPVAAPATIGNP